VYIVYIGHRQRSRHGGFPLHTAVTPVSQSSTAPSNNEKEALLEQALAAKDDEAIYWRKRALDGSTRQQHPQSYHPPPHSLPSQYPHYLPPNSNFAPGGGDAQHQGHIDPGGFVSHYPAYPHGGRQTEFSAQHERAPTNAHLQQMPSSLGMFSAVPSGYNSTTNSTARDAQRSTWPDGATQPPPYNYETNA